MSILRTAIVWLLIVGLATPALAGDLRESIAKAAEQSAQPATGPMPKAYLWSGAALFVGGMAVGLYGFLNNKNGEFPEFGEATATNKPLGTAGLAAAFAGGTLLALGARARRAPAITVGPGRVMVQLSWGAPAAVPSGSLEPRGGGAPRSKKNASEAQRATALSRRGGGAPRQVKKVGPRAH